jgi:divalent metal cation (Fe/Co/Zn/Cd) transporter
MGVLVCLAIGLAFWLVGFALGWKPVDAFLVTILLVLIAYTVRITKPFVQRLMGHETPSS